MTLALFLTASALLWQQAVWLGSRRGIALGEFPLLWLASASVAGTVLWVLGFAVCATAIVGIAVAAIVDARSGYIFDPLVSSAALGVFTVAAFQGAAPDALAGASSTAALAALIWFVSRRRGLGLGDVKLGALLGAGLGAADGAIAIGVAFVLGAAVALGLLLARRVRFGYPIRFGPYLLAGTLAVVAYHRFNTGVIR